MEMIRSGYADNAQARFVQLTNRTFQNGFDIDMVENVSAVLAVEGRRWNGYELTVPDLLSGNQWGSEIVRALVDLQSCNNTGDVVEVAVDLWLKIERLNEQEEIWISVEQ